MSRNLLPLVVNEICSRKLTPFRCTRVKKIVNVNLSNFTPDKQLLLLYNFNILPLIFRYFQHYCSFTHSLFKFNPTSSLVTSILIFNNRNKIIQPYLNSFKKKYSFSLVSSKILSLFIYSRLNLSKISFKKYINSNLIKLFNLWNHVWDLDIFLLINI